MTPATTQCTFDYVFGAPDFRALTNVQLAASCLYVAGGRVPYSRSFLRAEAMRLFLLWRKTLNARSGGAEGTERRAILLAALRKRTIQVLIRLKMGEPPLHSEGGAGSSTGNTARSSCP